MNFRSVKISFVATVAMTLLAASADSASVTVTNTADSGAGSLRDAVSLAATGDTIEFNISSNDPGYDSSAGLFTVTLTTGEIVIEKDLVIAGPSAANLAISGNDSSRIFRVNSGNVSLSNLSLVRGRVKGADGTGSQPSERDGRPGMGGAVLNYGTLTVARCTFEGNTAVGGNGLYTGGGGRAVGGDAFGGAIANYGRLSLLASTLAANSALGGRGAYAGFGITGHVAPDGTASGGAIYNADAGVLSATNCTIVGNSSTTPRVTSYQGPFSTPPATRAFGGGVSNVGSASLVHSTIVGNTANIGALTSGNGEKPESFGGGLYAGANSVSSLRDTIIAGNKVVPTVGAAGSGSAGPDVNGAVTSGGHNLLGRSDGCTGFTAGDLQGGTTEETRLDPKLGPFGQHGGPTKTLPLLADSPAVDAADNAPPTRDQRGLLRRGRPDIGSFEYEGAGPVVLGNISTRARIQAGDNAMIGGFIITGTETKTQLIRAVGPSLNLPGQLADPTIEVYEGDGVLIASNDNWQDAETRQQIVESGLAPKHEREPALWGVINPGTYTVVVRGKNNTSGIGLVEVYDLDRQVDSAFANISTRAVVETGDNVMIGGFIVVGGDARTVMVRALGPSLSAPGALSDPTLELYDANGALLTDNDNWRDEQESEIINTTIPPSDDSESAIVRKLAPGAYTAVVRGANQASGVALIEVYALD